MGKIKGNNSILDLPVNNFFKANEHRSFGPIFNVQQHKNRQISYIRQASKIKLGY